MLTRDDLADMVYENSEDVPNKSAARGVVKEVFATMARALEAGDEINIHGFGRFLLKERAARMGRNPSTGEDMQIAAKTVLQFKPVPSLKDRVNS